MTNGLEDFVRRYRQAHNDPIRRIETRLDLFEKRLNDLEKEIWEKLDLKNELDIMHGRAIENLRDALTLTREAISEHITDHELGTDILETRELIAELQRKLLILRRKEVTFDTGNVPTNLIIEIENTEKRIEELQEELR